MENVKYWLWLQKALGCGAEISGLISFFGSAKNVYKADEEALITSGIFSDEKSEISPKYIKSLKNTDLSEFDGIIKYCKENEISIITPENEMYPKKLLTTTNYPAVLFVKGDISYLNNTLTIAVVGTRTPSEYGVNTAMKICSDLAKDDCVIVSGGALGIDSVAHKTAIKEGAKTVLVLGCGHDGRYLKENEELRKTVTENGAVISEYSPLTKASPIRFPKRNRIISGISQAVVVIEAGAKSGTLNTALHAKRQNRDIFVVPGDVSSPCYSGSNKLIVDGARPIFSGKEIHNFYKEYLISVKENKIKNNDGLFYGIDEFNYGQPKMSGSADTKNTLKNSLKKEKNSEINKDNKKFIKITSESVSANAFLVYNVMLDKEMTLDEIVRAGSLPVNKVLSSLTELETLGAVSLCEGNRYIKI